MPLNVRFDCSVLCADTTDPAQEVAGTLIYSARDHFRVEFQRNI